MHSKNKSPRSKASLLRGKQILTAIIAVLISVSLVALAVYATTTVGNDVSVGGTLTVTGTSTLASTLYVNQATGRVGIGTASPSEKLTVSGGNILTDNLYVQQTIWTDKILESSNLQFMRAHHEIGGRSKGDAWTEAGTDALPVATAYHTSLVYDGKMWVIGGYDADWNCLSKVYYSTNGANWTEAGTDALPVGTGEHTSLVYDGKMWVIGGYTGGYIPKVYYSTDGITWTEAGTDALPVGIGSHTSLVYDGKMWVIGGWDVGYTRKVYYSTNGANWTEAGTDALPVATGFHTSLVYNGKMWVIGGYTGVDNSPKVYYSTDGITWTEAGTDALPVATDSDTSLVYDGKMWVIGGDTDSGVISKVYYSFDGANWTEAGTDTLPVTTAYHTSLVYDGRMWVIGGFDADWNYSPKVFYSLPAIKGGLVVQDQSNTELFRITPDGYVGIGTTTPTSTLQVQGSLGLDYVSKSSDYTATADDNIIAVDASSATTTITLPSSSGLTGRVYTIKKTDSSSNDVVVDGNASETIDGSATYTLTSQWKYLTIISDGTNWLIITNN